MSSADKSNSECLDPCGDFGPDQKWAVVWFFAVVLIGIFAVTVLRNTDYYNYTHNGEFYDYEAYKSNRLSATSIASENVDERAHKSLSEVTKNLK
ncbi:MAG: hypothetical protein KBC84_02940 [Proteobacteria bacterium]|nr:hypothetical protein [Pseudomonadota bacterium]